MKEVRVEEKKPIFFLSLSLLYACVFVKTQINFDKYLAIHFNLPTSIDQRN